MKNWQFLWVSFLISTIACGQKRSVNQGDFSTWPELSDPMISSNGKFVLYSINNDPIGSRTLVIQSVDRKWETKVIGASDAMFSKKSDYAIFKTGKDSLCIRRLYSEQVSYLSPINTFKLFNRGNKEYLLISKPTVNKELVQLDLATGKQSVIFNVQNQALSEDGEKILIEFGPESQDRFLEYIDFQLNERKVIWQSVGDIESRIEKMCFDHSGSQVAFLLNKNRGGIAEKELWYFSKDMDKATRKIFPNLPRIPEGFTVSEFEFSKDNKRIFISLSKRTSNSDEQVNVWNYMDIRMKSEVIMERAIGFKSLRAVLNLTDNTFFILKQENETLFTNSNGIDTFFILATEPCHDEQRHWNPACRSSLLLVNTNNGQHRLVKDGMINNRTNGFSPDGKFVIYYDRESQAFYSYNIVNSNTINITKDIPYSVSHSYNGIPDFPKPYSNTKSWLHDGKGLIIYDQYDIWSVDPSGIKHPVCLTNGFGRTNQIILRLLEEGQIKSDTHVPLIAFRSTDKLNGFFQLKLKGQRSLEMLTMESALFFWPSINNFKPLKASESDVWLVQRMSASEAPNYYITKNFKSFSLQTEFIPQKKFNWLTAELNEWTALDGQKLKGILYKPENFDANKEYPVIFHFYEEKSDFLNQFENPGYTTSRINIPHFVSNGYLIFVPDILFTIGEPSESINNAVVSAAQYLKQFRFVNEAKMGLQGHSFGGYGVNVLITKTNLFAAAAEAAGPTDFVSGYGSMLGNGRSNQFQYEVGQNRIGGTLWNKRELFIKNSPIFFANHVSTPLLITHGQTDGIVPFEQGVELFTALRRLRKKVWLLDYPLDGHTLGRTASIDYTTRLMQFFDHYLKYAPAPTWMTQGIPAKLKSVISGYDLDPAGNCGKDCNICKMWNDKMKKDSVATMRHIKEKTKSEHWMGGAKQP